MSERWGGWYVTGTHGDSLHMGNKFVMRSSTDRLSYQQNHGQNVNDLSMYFDTDKHLAKTSDILALMLMEHQVQVHNTLSSSKMAYLRRVYLAKAISGGKYDPDSTSARKIVSEHAEKILKTLLFADSIKLPADGIDGSVGVCERAAHATVVAAGPASKKDRAVLVSMPAASPHQRTTRVVDVHIERWVSTPSLPP